MPDKKKIASLTPALEDYLETIYLILQEKKIARVKEIAKMRGVKMASVSPAMRRLSDLGLIAYSQREFIDLTPKGEEVARRTLARHDLLTRFFVEILRMDAANAENDACAMEHHLSDEGMDKLSRLFEFIQLYPKGIANFIDRFHNCSLINPEIGTCTHSSSNLAEWEKEGKISLVKLSQVPQGEKYCITRINARGKIRERLLNIGLLPGVSIKVVRHDKTPDPSVCIMLGNSELSLTEVESEAVVVATEIQQA